MSNRLGGVLLVLLATLLSSSSSHAQFDKNGNPVCKAVGIQDQPDLISFKGDFVVVWRDFRDGDGDIYAQRVTSKGEKKWPANIEVNGQTICDAPGEQYSPRVVGTGGEVWVVWIDERDVGTKLIYAEQVNFATGATTFGNGKRVCQAASDQTEFDVENQDGPVIVWKDSRNDATTNKDIYAQYIDKNGVLKWGNNGTVVCKANGNQSNPKIVFCHDGLLLGFLVAWEDNRNGANDTDIFAQLLLLDDGSRQWNPNDGVPVCDQAGHQESIALARYDKYVAIAWQDGRAAAVDTLDIYAESIGVADHASQWAVGGMPVCKAKKKQWSPQILESFGELYLAWLDGRATGVSSLRVSAQRIKGGTAKWEADGVLVSQSGNQNTAPSFSIAMVGGNLASVFNLAFNDNLYGISTYSFLRDNGKFIERAGAAGVSSHDKPHKQVRAKTSDKGVFAVWTDERRGADNSDIYMNRVQFAEEPKVVPKDEERRAPDGATPTVSALTLLQNRPNPFASSTEFRIGLPRSAPTELEVFDVQGRRVFHRSAYLSAGWNSVPFDGRDEDGQLLPTGIYFGRVSALGESRRMKLVIQR